jgi:uncharacterized protein YbjT (DUF2867 family)
VNTLGWADQIRRDGVVRRPYGRASRSLIHERDVAAVAVRALVDDGHAGARYVLTGPESITQEEQVALIGEAIDRRLQWEELPLPQARSIVAAELGGAAYADRALRYWAGLVADPEPVTTTVGDVTGVPARPFREWARDHADDFR